MFAKQYTLKCKQEKKDVGVYFIFVVEATGDPSANDYKTAEKYWTDFHDKSKEIQVHEAKPTDADTTSKEDDERPF